MLLDLKKVQLKKSLLTGALWVVEQIPGYVLTMIKKIAVCCWVASTQTLFFSKIDEHASEASAERENESRAQDRQLFSLLLVEMSYR